MTFQPLSEAFIGISWYSVLPVLDTTGRYRVKKAVVGVTELIAALVPIHRMLAFFAGMYTASVIHLASAPAPCRSP